MADSMRWHDDVMLTPANHRTASADFREPRKNREGKTILFKGIKMERRPFPAILSISAN